MTCQLASPSSPSASSFDIADRSPHSHSEPQHSLLPPFTGPPRTTPLTFSPSLQSQSTGSKAMQTYHELGLQSFNPSGAITHASPSSGAPLLAAEKHCNHLQHALSTSLEGNGEQQQRVFNDLMAHLLNLASDISSATDCALVIMAAPVHRVSGDDLQPVTFLSHNIRPLESAIIPLISQVYDLFHPAIRNGADHHPQQPTACSPVAPGLKAEHTIASQATNTASPLNTRSPLLLPNDIQHHLSPQYGSNTDLCGPQPAAGIRALGGLVPNSPVVAVEQDPLSGTPPHRAPPGEFLVEPDVVYGVSDPASSREREDEAERNSIRKLDLNDWIIFTSDVLGFTMSDDDVAAICLMTWEVPPRHWTGYLWGLLEDEAKAKIVLEELRLQISHAKGYTTGPKVVYF
ncbi:hypothetical protein FRC00_004998 [Tulasnella sp. 408]|nr:hypothetical protein FRC00_004998 [Tulasnella sp. 408]